MARNNETHSRPLVARELVFSTMQAQKVVHRVFFRALRSLYSAEVILRVIADDNEVDRIERCFDELLSDRSGELAAEIERLRRLAEEHGIASELHYSEPRTLRLEVATPRAFHWIRLVEQLDVLMRCVDALWFGQIINGKERKEAGYDWQRSVLRTGWRIVEVERAAHKKARSMQRRTDPSVVVAVS